MRKKYFISVGRVDNTHNKNEKDTNVCANDNAAEVCYNIVNQEYLHTFNRSDKLDNKVYIVCAIIFIFVMGLFNAIITFKHPADIYQFELIYIYIVGTIVITVMFLYTLVRLATLLKANTIKTISANYIIDKNLQKQTSHTVYTFEAVQCVESIKENNIQLEKRFKQYNNIITNIVWIVIIAFILNMMKILIKIN